MSNDDVKKRIKNEGFPLQRFCAKKLQNLGWTVEEEYPVEQSTPVEPNPYSHKETIRDVKRTSGDIRAIFPKPVKEYAVCICISCKRQLKIDWVFMKAMFREDVHIITKILKDSPYGYNSYVFKLEDKWDVDFPLCNIPTNLQKPNQDLPREQDKIIQTCNNLYLETLQTMEDYETSLIKNDLPYKQIIFIPIIVTAAKIHVYDIDEKDFDIEDEEAIKVEKVPYLLYQHSLPRSLHRYLFDEKNNDNEIIHKQFNLFVVEYQNFESFIQALMKKFESIAM